MTFAMTRRVTFSTGHRYWFDHLSAEENGRLFGPFASRFSHGHNYVLHVTVEGPIHPKSGMIVNIKDLDAVLKGGIVRQLDQKSLNDEVEPFATVAPTLENLIRWIATRIVDLPPPCVLTKLRLEETPRLWADLELRTMNLTLTRTYEFAASHRLWSPHLTEEENLAAFGKCSNPMGHGHNYVLEVTVTGSPDPVTGMLVALDDLDRAVNELVVDRYDHRNLSEEIPELADKVATSEEIVSAIFRQLDGKLPARLVHVRLWETARNAFDVSI
ncbi:MAG: 6-carboxytetrahydropterin synthase [Fimbriimonadaceae bacterium]